jgi:Zn finger protein HypA/HybF involved in hydrogenase expression
MEIVVDDRWFRFEIDYVCSKCGGFDWHESTHVVAGSKKQWSEEYYCEDCKSKTTIIAEGEYE